MISVFFRALRWKYLLIHLKHIRMKILYVVVVIGYMANSLLPMRIGELVRSYYLSKESNISKSSVLATILVERVLDAVTLLLFIGIGAIFVPMAGISSLVPFVDLQLAVGNVSSAARARNKKLRTINRVV